MKKKYGFTLIELLAVIVVLAVIAMITTPIVFVIIKTAKKGAAEQSTVAYAKAIEDTVAIDAMNNRSYVNRDDYSYDEIKVDVSGSTPTGGLYALKDGIVTRGVFCVNGYRVNYSDSKAEAYENCDDLKWEGNIVLEETKGNLEYNKIKKVQIKENKANNSLIVSVEDENIAQARIENNELIITGKKLGTTKITLSSSETKNYSSASTEYIVTIIKASNKIVLSSTSGTYTYPNSGTFSITSNPSGGKLSCTTSNKNVAECTISGNTVTVKPGTTKGSATLTITSEATTNYNAGKAAYVAITEPGALSGYTANGYEGVYDGNPHGITVTAGGSTITYSTDGTNYSSTSPTLTNVGEMVVYYKISKPGYSPVQGSKKIVITKAAGKVTSPTAKALKYTGNAQELVNAGSSTTGQIQYKVGTTGTYSTKIPTGTDVGTYTVYYKVVGDSNHNDVAERSLNVTIKPTGPTKVKPTSTDTHKGIVYLDPTNLKNSCNVLNSVSGTGTKTGCMKWYIYSEDNNSYTMILDHNTTAGAGVAYNSTNSNGEMKEVKTALESDTSTWDKSLKARLITANEVAKITGNTSFDEKTSTWDSEFYFDSNNQTQVANKTNKSKYAWLYDYTSGCADYGCNIEHPVYFGYDTNGYWTSATLADDSCAWAVNRRGELYPEPKSYNYLGTRPVITISKSIIS